MRHLKIVGLALVVGLVGMAILGSASAAAAPAVCLSIEPLTNKNHEGCLEVEGILHKLIKTIIKAKAKAKNPILKGALEETCETSETELENSGTGEEEDETIEGTVTALSFSGNCKPCSTVTTFAPYEGATLAMEGGEESYYLTVDGSAKLSGCPFGVTCKFGKKGIRLDIGLEGGTFFEAKAEELTLEEGSKLICGSKGTWTANYEVTSPENLVLILE